MFSFFVPTGLVSLAHLQLKITSYGKVSNATIIELVEQVCKRGFVKITYVKALQLPSMIMHTHNIRGRVKGMRSFDVYSLCVSPFSFLESSS